MKEKEKTAKTLIKRKCKCQGPSQRARTEHVCGRKGVNSGRFLNGRVVCVTLSSQ